MKRRPALLILAMALSALSVRALPAPVKTAPEKTAATPAATPAELKKLQAGCDGGKAADCLALADKSAAAAQLALFEKACKLNDGEGCVRYGMRLHVPLSGETRKDPEAASSLEKALKRFEQDCIAGAEGICAKFIAAHEDPNGLLFALESIQLERTIAVLAESRCRKNPPQVCEIAIIGNTEGRGVARNPAKAEELVEFACRAGDGHQCLRRYKNVIAERDNPGSKERAAEYWQLAKTLLENECAHGHGQSCNTLVGNHGDAPSFYFDDKATDSSAKAILAFERYCRAGDEKNCIEWIARLKPIFADSTYEPPAEARYLACLSGILDYCKGELEQLAKTLDSKDRKTVFTVEQIKAMGARFFEISGAIRRHCRSGDLAFCLQALDTRMPDFEHAGLSEAREKLVASLLAKHLRDACDRDDLAACEKLSEQYKLISEKAVNPDHLEKIAKLFETRCRAGNLPACVEFHARKLWQGLDADPARAERYLEETAANARLACTRGQTAACHDEMQADFFLGAARPELPLHPELAADAALAQFESGKFCDGMSQSECADTLFTALLELPDPAPAVKRFDRLATGLPGFMKSGCEAGNGKACLLLAALTKEPLSPDAESNPDSRDAPAKNLIAYLENAWAIKPDPGAAAALLARGARLLQGDCRRGDFSACMLAAQSEPEAAGDGPSPAPEDPLKQALSHNRRVCADGDASACGRMGDHLMRENDEQLKPETAALLAAACRGGESRGCLHFARLAITGRAMTEAGIAEAAARFRIACDAKNGAGCRRILMMRDSGMALPEVNAAKLAQLLEQGCGYGDKESCHFFGINLLRGKSEPQRGLQQLAANCEQQVLASCEFLGGAYQYGLAGLPKDRTLSRRYHLRACDLGSASSCESVKELDKPEEPKEPDDSPAPDVGLQSFTN